MESCLIWRPCRWCRLGQNSWKQRYVNIAIVSLGILVALPVGLKWEEIRYTSCVKFVWESVLATAGNREITYDRLLIVLATCLALTAMISILHIAFKVPFNLFANAESTPCSDKLTSAKVQDLKHRTELLLDHGKDGGAQHPERGVVSPQSSERGAVSPDVSNTAVFNVSNNSHTTALKSPLDDDQQSEEDVCTSLLTDTTTSFDIQSDNVTSIIHELVEYMTDIELIQEELMSQENECKCEAEVSHREDIFADIETQTDEEIEQVLSSVGTMTLGSNLVDVSVNTHQRVCKIVKNCGTSTSGPFMKKLRRAQRLLKEAKFKAKVERQDKVGKWRAVMNRYKDKLTKLFENLEKKDRLLGYTAINRALSENEVKEICTAVRSSRDRLHTQCKLNSALREVIESKSETPTPVGPTPVGLASGPISGPAAGR